MNVWTCDWLQHFFPCVKAVESSLTSITAVILEIWEIRKREKTFINIILYKTLISGKWWKLGAYVSNISLSFNHRFWKKIQEKLIKLCFSLLGEYQCCRFIFRQQITCHQPPNLLITMSFYQKYESFGFRFTQWYFTAQGGWPTLRQTESSD